MPQTEVSEETLEKIKEQLGSEIEVSEINNYEDLIGQKLFIRTVTYFSLGKVEKIVGDFLEMSTASFIGDTGRFMQFIKDGVLEEVEPVGKVYINLKSIVDFYPWKHKLPTEQK